MLASDAGDDTFGAAIALVFEDFVEGDRFEDVEGAVLEDLDCEDEAFLLTFLEKRFGYIHQTFTLG